MKRLALLCLSFALLVVGCRDTQAPTEPQVLPQPASAIGEGEEDIRKLIDALFPGPGGLRRAANNQFDKVVRALDKQGLDEAQLKMFELIKFTLTRQDEGQLIEPAAQGVSDLIDLLYKFVGLTVPNVVALVPETGATVLTKEGFAGVAIPDAAIDEAILVTIRQIDQSPCLPTGLIQADGCWEYQRFPAGDFIVPVGVEICVDVGVIDDGPGQAVADLTELHKFSPATGVVKLSLDPGGIGVACDGFPPPPVIGDAGLEGFPALARKVHDRLIDLLGPPPLSASALVATSRPRKLSGATGSFTDMGGAVPVTVGINAGDGQTAPVGTSVAIAPSVVVDTGGFPIAGVEITFSVASGGGSITSPIATTNSSGIATIGSWTLGLGANSLIATTRAAGDSVTFTATGTGTATLPDLVVSSLTHSPSSPTDAENITFTAVVENIGPVAAGPSTLKFIIGGIDTVDAPASLFSIPALGPGATFVVQRTTALGVLTFLNTAVADENDDVPEADEANNNNTDLFTVTSSGVGCTLGVITIDGLFCGTEWIQPAVGASVFPAIVNLPGGGTASARVYVTNDATDLLMAVVFEHDLGSFFTHTVSVRLDENPVDGSWNAGTDGHGDDGWTVQHKNASGVRVDLMLDSHFNSGVNQGQRDDLVTMPTGTNDGATAIVNNGASTVIEMSHPLNSGDLRDAVLTPLDSYGLSVFTFLKTSGGSSTTSNLIPQWAARVVQ